MAFSVKPEITRLPDGGCVWQRTFDAFRVKVYVPRGGHPLKEIINFGFLAPYLLIFEENEMSIPEAVAFSDENGFSGIASEASSSVVFIFPTNEGGWDKTDRSLFVDLIAESAIGPYYEDGMLRHRNRFTKEWTGYSIRGAIFRTFLYGFGKSADYIAKNLMTTLNGQYLWGPGEITPCAVTLENLTYVPDAFRPDIPIVSVGNSECVNTRLSKHAEYFLSQDKRDIKAAYAAFLAPFKRWCGVLQREDDLPALGLLEDFFAEEIETSKDNLGDDTGSERHWIGCAAYYKEALIKKGNLPLVLAFHGGGDSTFYLTRVSGWCRVAARNDFLLVAVENHMNSTASEMISLIEKLKSRYPIDEKRIYAAGFSMGGCKTWDLFQEYPEVFAGLAPMSATFEVGLNLYGKPAPKAINRNTPVPVFYAGGEITPLPELPFQAQKCIDRVKYVFEVNKVKTPYNVTLENKENWEDPVYGVCGDKTEKYFDESRNSTLTVRFFESDDGITRTAFASVSGQGHECREHTCEQAWKFLSAFSRE